MKTLHIVFLAVIATMGRANTGRNDTKIAAAFNSSKPTKGVQGKQGLTGDFCEYSYQCSGARDCLETDGTYFYYCSGIVDCYCIPEELTSCSGTSSSECFDGEVCDIEFLVCLSPFVALGGTGSTAPPAPTVDTPPPASTGDTPPANNGGTNGGVCIATEFLTHLKRHQLIYEQDRLSHVLCDAKRSCASPGHVVRFKGETMMMKTYCKKVECTNDVMAVNSPKWRRGMRVSSNTDDLEFTAFAARYATHVEEHVLRAAVRMGM